MKEILFVTGNKEKVKWAREMVKRFGISVIHKDMDIPEVKNFDFNKVLDSKADFVRNKIKKPFVVDDNGFYINCLNGFPGPFIKLAVNVLGVNNLVHLVGHYKDKTAVFKSGLMFVDSDNSRRMFIAEGRGKIVSPRGNSLRGWGELFKIYQPEGWNKTLAEMGDNEWNKFMKELSKIDHFRKFARWFNKKVK